MLTDGLSQSQLERKIARQRDDIGKRAAAGAVGAGGGCKQNLHADVFQHLLLLRFFQDLEARRDVGFERKLLQEPRAEGVDGLHLQAAGCLQRLGEQLARPRASFGVDLPDAGQADFGVELFVVERGPARQPLEHAVRHVGGGRLGIGEAEDFRGVSAFQQQANHALRQHEGLAGACIGRHPGGHGGIGRLDLPRRDRVGNLAGRTHRRAPPCKREREQTVRVV